MYVFILLEIINHIKSLILEKPEYFEEWKIKNILYFRSVEYYCKGLIKI